MSRARKSDARTVAATELLDEEARATTAGLRAVTDSARALIRERDELAAALATAEEQLASLRDQLASLRDQRDTWHTRAEAHRTACEAAELANADLRARIERADRELERADAVDPTQRVLELVTRMAPTERGELLEQLSTLHRQFAPGSLARAVER